MAIVNRYFPNLATSGRAFVALPPEAEALPGSPADIRLRDNYTDYPIGNGPSDPLACELAWRVLLALKHHGEWAAIRSVSLLAELAVEDARPYEYADNPPRSSRRVAASLLAPTQPPYPSNPVQVARTLKRALDWLDRFGFIGRTADNDCFWPTPKLVTSMRFSG